MPIQSKYSNQEIESLISDILLQLEKNNASVELSLMALGNSITHLINNEVRAENRQSIAQSFCQALQSSIDSSEPTI